MAVKRKSRYPKAGEGRGKHIQRRLQARARAKGLKPGSEASNRYIYGGLTNVAKRKGVQKGRKRYSK